MSKILARTAPSHEGAREKNANRHGAALGVVCLSFFEHFSQAASAPECIGAQQPALEGSSEHHFPCREVSTSHAHTIPLLSLGIAQRLASTALRGAVVYRLPSTLKQKAARTLLARYPWRGRYGLP
jgi:hypothetical protein